MNLEKADIRDVLKTFAQLLAEHGYTWRMDGGKMLVSKK